MNNKKTMLYMLLFFLIVLQPLLSFDYAVVNSTEDEEIGLIEIKNKVVNNTAVEIPTKDKLSQYFMNMTFNESLPNPLITGLLNFSYLNTEDIPMDTLYFNLWPNGVQSNSLVINSIKNSSDSDLPWAISDEIYLKVNLSSPVQVNSRATVLMNFTTYLPFVDDRFGFQNSSSITGKTLFSFTNWYPILAVYENGNFSLHPYVAHAQKGTQDT